MAYPSPSPPSGSRRRRLLSEVLGEQQEPFSLDIYLLERGCNSSFLDATACGGGACSTCWPKTGRTLRRPARNKKGSRRSGVLTMLLSKILRGTSTTVPAPTKRNRKVRKQRAAIGWRRVVAEKQRTPDSSELALHSASPGAGAGAGAVDVHTKDDGEQEDDDDEDESSKKQLSPVSVLEQLVFEQHSPPPPPHAPKALAIFGELLEAAYTPNTLLDDVLAITQSKDGQRCSTTDSSTPTPTPRARRRRKKKKHHTHRKEDVTSLVVSAMAGAAGVRAEDLRPSVEDVGAAIAAAVLDALAEETAAELMGIHGPRLCG